MKRSIPHGGLAKDNLPDFIEKLLKLHKYHKELMDEMKLQKELSDRNPYGRPYEYMDEYEAAIMILKRKKIRVLGQGNDGWSGR